MWSQSLNSDEILLKHQKSGRKLEESVHLSACGAANVALNLKVRTTFSEGLGGIDFGERDEHRFGERDEHRFRERDGHRLWGA